MDTNDSKLDASTETSEKDDQTTTSSEETTKVEDQKKDAAPVENSNKDFNKESLLADLHKERSARKELKAQVEELTSKAAATTELSEKYSGLETKYSRLEEFLTTVGGPISKALDSRSFTKSLFESDAEISELVDKWHKENPSQTSSALSGGSSGGSPKLDVNAALRSLRNS